ncbi:hypothetical protein IFM89_004841 [Coptis chinensis]|uniref:L-ascorbate oxidase n=1 Tax=Coptis chinensis TaxID=261450 RepID=A0A835H4N9_9MAGN|nr:hypothetical protein IFM89_004841 [Coptis chinensis]
MAETIFNFMLSFSSVPRGCYWPEQASISQARKAMDRVKLSPSPVLLEDNIDFRVKRVQYQMVITINGRTPGPTILAQQGDTIIVELKNSLFVENVAIHWHGIRQIGTPWSDGTAGVTQCPILPGETFTYKFVVDKAGTYLYHGHYGMQRTDGLYGSIQVSVPDGITEPFAYDYDQSIILTDWYHKSSTEQAIGLSSKPFGWIGEPQSLLIQGRGTFNCSTLNSLAIVPGLCNTSNPECSPYVLTVVPGKVYRLRISSLTSLSAFNFEIEGHNMTVVESDGNYVEPFIIKNLNIYSGETYSVLVKADQDSSRNYWATSNVVSRKPQTPTGLAIFNYYQNDPQKLPPTMPTTGPLWNDSDYRLAQSIAIKARQGYIHPPPRSSDRVIILLNTQNQIDGYLHWAVNNVSFTLPSTPYLIALKDKLGYGKGKFDPNNDPKKYNLIDPIMKNTVPVHPYAWTALRFRANNPGVWAFHCHIEAHLFMGMGVVFEEGVNKVGKLPLSITGCGKSKVYYRP